MPWEPDFLHSLKTSYGFKMAIFGSKVIKRSVFNGFSLTIIKVNSSFNQKPKQILVKWNIFIRPSGISVFPKFPYSIQKRKGAKNAKAFWIRAIVVAINSKNMAMIMQQEDFRSFWKEIKLYESLYSPQKTKKKLQYQH